MLQQVVGQSIIYAQRYGFVLAFSADVTFGLRPGTARIRFQRGEER